MFDVERAVLIKKVDMCEDLVVKQWFFMLRDQNYYHPFCTTKKLKNAVISFMTGVSFGLEVMAHSFYLHIKKYGS